MRLKFRMGLLVILMVSFGMPAAPQENTDHSTHIANGCLLKSPTPHIYLLTDENGKIWNLSSPTVPLGSHVGHTVSVKGTIAKESKDSSDTTPENNLVVTELDMVRNNCKQP